MKRTIQFALTSMLALSIPLLASLQGEEKQEKKSGEMSSMHGMMKECHAHCEETASSLGEMRKSLAEARESNDPVKMRAAIEQAEKPLGRMQEHMSMCKNMMNMMGMMHGEGMGEMEGGGMMGHGAMHGSKDAANTAVDPVCGMKVDPKTAPSATYQGKTYYFCSAAEKARFENDPESFLSKSRK